jgi:hypothetical protein
MHFLQTPEILPSPRLPPWRNWSRSPDPIQELQALAYASDPLSRQRLHLLHAQAAVAFGLPRGWAPAHRRKPIDLSTLTGGSHERQRAADDALGRVYRELFDHPEYFRRGSPHGKAAAIVAHPYKPAFDLQLAEDFARAHRLRFRTAGDPELV